MGRSISARPPFSAASSYRRVANVARANGTTAARQLFRFSLVYLALMCAVMVIDRVVNSRSGAAMSRLLWTLSLGVFAGALDLSVLSPALPALGKYLQRQSSDSPGYSPSISS